MYTNPRSSPTFFFSLTGCPVLDCPTHLVPFLQNDLITSSTYFIPSGSSSGVPLTKLFVLYGFKSPVVEWTEIFGPSIYFTYWLVLLVLSLVVSETGLSVFTG